VAQKVLLFIELITLTAKQLQQARLSWHVSCPSGIEFRSKCFSAFVVQLSGWPPPALQDSINTEQTHTDIHALRGIRTHDPSVSAGGHCARRFTSYFI
jgi:hypothetical protein